ncbi:MAG: polysaccharide deacetylase family protein [Solirubrobacterales bacterium]|nr:polysaccharide deacetylase family protein [Solirubrobacterales bacterium]
MVRRFLLPALLPLCLLLAACGGSGPTAPAATTGTASTTTAGGGKQVRAAAKRAGLRKLQRQALAYYAQQGRPIFCGGKKRYAALTFDDGPGPYTPLARKYLKKFGVEATFFLVGRNVQPYAIQARDEKRGGHALGDHSWSHPYLPNLSTAEITRQLGDTQAAIRQATGTQVQLFRPPYGAHDARVDAEAQRLGMAQILWNVDSRDSEGADYAEIARRVLDGIGPGAIVLMHENRGQTIRALWSRILPALKKRHIELVSVPHLLAVNPPSQQQLHAPGGGCSGITGQPGEG